MSPGQRKEMINRNHDTLSLSAQCRVLNISRSTLCYRPMGESAEILSLMKAIDKLFTKYPFFGSRQIASWLARDGIKKMIFHLVTHQTFSNHLQEFFSRSYRAAP